MEIFVIVFEDSSLELVDYGCLFTDKDMAETVMANYQRRCSKSLLVRSMPVDTRKDDKQK